jgi:anti-sigma B factor antagonist
MALRIAERHSGPVTVLELTGRITLGEESVQLRNKLETLMKGQPRLVLDMANVNYIDSAGLATLIASFTSPASQGVRMVLANLTKRLEAQLSITRLITVFEAFASVDDAVKSFERSRQ